jgi:anti-sigma factor RsiW
MDCTQCAEALTAFLDGELSRPDSEGIRTHLQSCPSCAAELQGLREAAEFVASHHRELEPGPESWNLVRARIHQKAPPSRFGLIRRWQIAAATAAVLAAFALLYLQQQQTRTQNLNRYIAQYVQQREAQIRSRAEMNPFMEISSTFNANPFRSEDR